MPKISVVMPAYNAEKYIAEAIESILSQTFRDFEFIIINDGSTDRTKEIILSFGDARIVYLENEKNLGIVETLNRGLDAARGEYIARMDADDAAMPERFEKQLAYMEKHPEVGVLGCGIRIFGEGTFEHDRTFSTSSEDLQAELLFSSCMAHPSVMIRRAALGDIRYEKEFAGAEDYLMWWRLAQRCSLSTLPEVLQKYRIHGGQITADKSEKYRKLISDLLGLRLSDIGFSPDEKGRAVLFTYCLGETESFDENDAAAFCGVLADILHLNKNTGFFGAAALHRTVGGAVLNAAGHLDANAKKKTVRLASRDGLLPVKTRIGMLVRKAFRR